MFYDCNSYTTEDVNFNEDSEMIDDSPHSLKEEDFDDNESSSQSNWYNQ